MQSPSSQPLTPTAIAAVFDVDRTLIPGTTSERLFIRYLARKRVIGFSTFLHTSLYLARSLPRMSPMEAIRQRRVYLAGQRVGPIVALAERCYAEEIRLLVSAAGRTALQDHKAQGHLTVLLSGSLDFLIRPLQADLGADHLIATHMEVVNDRFTGAIAGPWPYGDTKALLINHFAEEHGVDFAASYAYADHHSDEAVLALFGNPVVINPRSKMQQIAAGRRWPTREF